MLSPSRAAVSAAALVALVAGCAGTSAGSDEPGSGERANAADRAPDCTPAPLTRRAAAVLVVGMPGVTTSEDELGQQLVDAGVSGLFLNHANVEGEEQVRDLVAGLKARATHPMLVTTDQESGRVAVLRPLIGRTDSARQLALTRTPDEVREFASDLGDTLDDLGIDWDFAPLLDLDEGDPNGVIGNRSFSADPERAGDYGLAYSAGLLEAGVLPTVKHFPGHGRSTKDTHRENEVVEASLEDLRDTDLAPFQRAIDAGLPVVMMNHLAYRELDPHLPASMSPRAYELLRDMGFEGVAITDSIGMGPVNLRWDFPEAAVRAIEAGADAVLASQGDRGLDMRDALVEAVESGELPEERLDEAAERMHQLAGGEPGELTCVDVTLPTPSLDDLAAEPSSSATP